jgi:Tol biopolymer transport system component
VTPLNGNQGGQTRILAIPVNGGSPREVLRGKSIIDFQCARAPANVCILTHTTGEKTQYSTFDPKTGVLKPALTIQGGILSESFSPDGTTLAAVPAGSRGRIPTEIQLYRLRDASRTTLKLEGWGINFGLDWNPDGKSLWINANNSKNAMAVVNVDLQGNVTPLFEDTENQVGWAVPSPDGSRVAYYKNKFTSDVWLLRDF